MGLSDWTVAMLSAGLTVPSAWAVFRGLGTFGIGVYGHVRAKDDEIARQGLG